MLNLLTEYQVRPLLSQKINNMIAILNKTQVYSNLSLASNATEEWRITRIAFLRKTRYIAINQSSNTVPKVKNRVKQYFWNRHETDIISTDVLDHKYVFSQTH